MIEYVNTYGGLIEVTFRSPKHSRGATVLSEGLFKELKELTGLRPSPTSSMVAKRSL